MYIILGICICLGVYTLPLSVGGIAHLEDSATQLVRYADGFGLANVIDIKRTLGTNH